VKFPNVWHVLAAIIGSLAFGGILALIAWTIVGAVRSWLARRRGESEEDDGEDDDMEVGW
jgi:hypothetical protein